MVCMSCMFTTHAKGPLSTPSHPFPAEKPSTRAASPAPSSSGQNSPARSHLAKPMRPPNTRLSVLFKQLNFCLEFPWPCLLAWPREQWAQLRQLVHHQTSSGPTKKFPFLIHSSHPQTKRTPPSFGGRDPSCLSDLPPGGGGAPSGLGFHKGWPWTSLSRPLSLHTVCVAGPFCGGGALNIPGLHPQNDSLLWTPSESSQGKTAPSGRPVWLLLWG